MGCSWTSVVKTIGTQLLFSPSRLRSDLPVSPMLLQIRQKSQKSLLTAIFPSGPGVSRYWNVSILDFVGAKDDGGSGDNWSYRTCKAPVKLLPPTSQYPTFYRNHPMRTFRDGQSKISTHSRYSWFPQQCRSTEWLTLSSLVHHTQAVGRISKQSPSFNRPGLTWTRVIFKKLAA